MTTREVARDRNTQGKIMPDLAVPDPPAGHVWVEWVGEASPMDSPIVQYRMLTGHYTAEQEAIVRSLAKKRTPRVAGHIRMVITKSVERGLGNLTAERVAFGWNARAAPGTPGSFIQALTHKDAETVKASAIGHQFRIWRERDGEPGLLIEAPRGHISLVNRETFADVKDFNRAMGW